MKKEKLLDKTILIALEANKDEIDNAHRLADINCSIAVCVTGFERNRSISAHEYVIDDIYRIADVDASAAVGITADIRGLGDNLKFSRDSHFKGIRVVTCEFDLCLTHAAFKVLFRCDQAGKRIGLARKQGARIRIKMQPLIRLRELDRQVIMQVGCMVSNFQSIRTGSIFDSETTKESPA